ncbi:MAG: tetratricopeptide repeat protein [Candidatus Omnitrophota bacterium]
MNGISNIIEEENGQGNLLIGLFVFVYLVFVLADVIFAANFKNWKYLPNISNIEQKIAANTKIIESERGQNNSGEKLIRAYIARSFLYTELEKYDQALKDLYRALEINRLDHIVHNNLAWVFYNLHELEKALENANIAIELEPENFFSLNNRALILMELNKLDEAMRDISGAIKLNRDHAFSYFTRGRIYVLQREKKKAGKDFRRAIQLDRNLKKNIDEFRAIARSREGEKF